MKKESLINVGKGAAIGVAMIIPGVSGGTIAVLLNIYEKMICAITNFKNDFKNSVKYLFPILLGMVMAFVAMYFPIKYALQYIPFQTICLFAGLMLGSTPKMIADAKRNGFKKIDILSITLPFIFVIGICFIPNMGNVNLMSSMPVYGYFLLFLVGIIGSCALVVPGVSGSMLLLILGYYQPILNTISKLKVTPIHSLLVLLIFALGMIIGFFSIAKIMKLLLQKFPRATYWAIVSFVMGSIIAIFLSFDYAVNPVSFVTVLVSIIVGIVAMSLSYMFTKMVTKRKEE